MTTPPAERQGEFFTETRQAQMKFGLLNNLFLLLYGVFGVIIFLVPIVNIILSLSTYQEKF